MILAHRVALDGIELDQVDERILVTSVREPEPRMTVTGTGRGGDGQRITEFRRDWLEIQVGFKIRLRKRQMAERDEVKAAVMAWARNGGWLTTTQKPGKRLRVKLTGFPNFGDPWKWADEYTLVFRAAEMPYWEDIDAVSVSFAGSQVGSLSAGGTAKTVCNAEWVNSSGATVNGITITVGSSKMVFSSLGLPNGGTLVIDHTDDGILRIRKKVGNTYTSAMESRTTGSSNELTAEPGAETRCSVTPTYNGRATVSCRGRWL